MATTATDIDSTGVHINFGDTVKFFDRTGIELEGIVTARCGNDRLWINHPLGGAVLRDPWKLTVIQAAS